MKSKELRTLRKKLTLCSIYERHGNFEVQFDIYRKDVLIEPKDEDFGVWAWNSWSLERAEQIAGEIETGKRKIVQMAAQV